MDSEISKGTVLEKVDQNVAPASPVKRFTLTTPSRTVRKKISRLEESRIRKNTAIAAYFSAKKQCLKAKLNIFLENENYKLRNAQLVLETEKLKLELEKLKKL